MMLYRYDKEDIIMAKTTITVATLNTRINALTELVERNVELTSKLCDIVTSLNAAPVKASAKAPVKGAKQMATKAKASAKAPKKGAEQKKADAPAVVNYGTWNGYCEARRKAAGFGDKWVDKSTFYGALDKIGWEKTHSYRGRFYHHGSPIESKKVS